MRWKSGTKIPIPPLSDYAEDVDPSQVIQLDHSHPFQQAVETAKTRANHLPEDLELGDFVRDNDGHTIFVPSKGYIAYLKEYQWLKWISESEDYDEAKNSWSVIFTSNWVPVDDYFRFLGLMGVEVYVEYFDEFMEYAGEYQYKNHEGVDQCYEGDEAILYMIKKLEEPVQDVWCLNVMEYNSFEEYTQHREHSNPELIAMIKAYYDNKQT